MQGMISVASCVAARGPPTSCDRREVGGSRTVLLEAASRV